MTTATTEPTAIKQANGRHELTDAIRAAAASSVALGRKLGEIAASSGEKLFKDAARQFASTVPYRLGCRPSAAEIDAAKKKMPTIDDDMSVYGTLARLQAGQEIEARLQIAIWSDGLSEADELAMEKAIECIRDGCFELEMLHTFAAKDEVFDRIDEERDAALWPEGPGTFKPDAVSVARHRHRDKPDSIRVTYHVKNTVFTEWVCLDHTGFAKTKAKAWWKKRFGEPIPSVDEALKNPQLGAEIFAMTKEIVVEIQDERTVITKHTLTK